MLYFNLKVVHNLNCHSPGESGAKTQVSPYVCPHIYLSKPFFSWPYDMKYVSFVFSVPNLELWYNFRDKYIFLLLYLLQHLICSVYTSIHIIEYLDPTRIRLVAQHTNK